MSEGVMAQQMERNRLDQNLKLVFHKKNTAKEMK